MKTEINDETTGYKIGAVARLTGISPDTLRIWERRYDVVTPERTSTGDRLYSSEDITRLQLIKRLVDSGNGIGSVASLPLNIAGPYRRSTGRPESTPAIRPG